MNAYDVFGTHGWLLHYVVLEIQMGEMVMINEKENNVKIVDSADCVKNVRHVEKLKMWKVMIW